LYTLHDYFFVFTWTIDGFPYVSFNLLSIQTRFIFFAVWVCVVVVVIVVAVVVVVVFWFKKMI
jgi:hypothetical protein